MGAEGGARELELGLPVQWKGARMCVQGWSCQRGAALDTHRAAETQRQPLCPRRLARVPSEGDFPGDQ